MKEDKIVDERLSKLIRKDIKLITSDDIRSLYNGLNSDQKKIATKILRNFLIKKAEEDIEERRENVETEKIITERESRKQYFRSHDVCESIIHFSSKIEDQNSIYKDTEFLEKITGCRIGKKKLKRKNK